MKKNFLKITLFAILIAFMFSSCGTATPPQWSTDLITAMSQDMQKVITTPIPLAQTSPNTK